MIDMENINLIKNIVKDIKIIKNSFSSQTDKKWLNTRELSDYIGYSMDSINKMVKEDIFIDGVHYYKPSKKLLFNKFEVDNWVMGIRSDSVKQNIDIVVDGLLANIKR